ncbi:hypothetical protein CEXT_747591 [Caerostris extrusa]|uniref:Uncharacterized protein n=1 Tax=Caerostris extrusa TaxID=172846 RepID=A0AAV4T3G2_CAEEX|nr:hypothetical protein CEXT_747591 [Caerostris extrusa]
METLRTGSMSPCSSTPPSSISILQHLADALESRRLQTRGRGGGVASAAGGHPKVCKVVCRVPLLPGEGGAWARESVLFPDTCLPLPPSRRNVKAGGR